MVQIFFPNITSIPIWVDKSGKVTNRKWSYKEAQICLNEGLSSMQVAKKVGTTKAAIDCACTLGNLIRVEKVYLPIVQFDLNMNYIKTWDNQSKISKEMKFNGTNVESCCNKIAKTAHRFKWMFLKDYEQLNNTITKEAI